MKGIKVFLYLWRVYLIVAFGFLLLNVYEFLTKWNWTDLLTAAIWCVAIWFASYNIKKCKVAIDRTVE